LKKCSVATLQKVHRGRGVTSGGKGGAIPRAPNHYEAPNYCGGAWKVPTMSQVLSSIQKIWFRKISVSNMGAPNLLLAPGAI